MSNDLVALRMVVIGHVQGVGFRAFIQMTCRAHGVSGWVRNRDDGAVEAELQGPRTGVDAALAAIRSSRAHQIRELLVDSLPPPTPTSARFEIRW